MTNAIRILGLVMPWEFLTPLISKSFYCVQPKSTIYMPTPQVIPLANTREEAILYFKSEISWKMPLQCSKNSENFHKI